MAGKLFISYRRDDAPAEARSIYLRLSQIFGAESLFMDVNTIEKGADFTITLDRALAESNAMLVVIGRNWVDARDDRGNRRLDDPGDFVRQEVAAALRRNIAVIPVRVGGAQLPKADELPNDLKPLVVRQSAIVSHENFARDMDGIERAVRAFIRPSSSKRLGLGLAAAFAVAAVGAAVAIPLWLRAPSKPGNASPCLAGRQPLSEAAEVSQQYAQLLSADKQGLYFQWAGGLAASDASFAKEARIVDVFAEGAVLTLRYDWHRGVLRLTPIMAGYSKYVRFAGDWSQINGNGCIELGIVVPEYFSRPGEEYLASGTWSAKESSGTWSARIVAR